MFYDGDGYYGENTGSRGTHCAEVTQLTQHGPQIPAKQPKNITGVKYRLAPLPLPPCILALPYLLWSMLRGFLRDFSKIS